ncbi:MAG: amidohydrolase [SAR202 cluster bacterium]|nr:amidohydrolase [SAR202 cluster bacterium]
MTIDFHTHIYPEWLRDQREKYLSRDATFGELFVSPKAKMATAQELIAAMDEDGVQASVVMGVGWTDQGLARDVNDYIIDAVRMYPGRIVGFGGVNPAWGDAAVTEAERCARAGLRGIGELHPDTQGFAIQERRAMEPLVEVLREYRLILTTHSSEPVGHLYQGKGHTTPDKLWAFIESFPDVKVVCAHWGGGLPFYALMPEVAEGLANVYFDTAASPFLYSAGIFRQATALVGAGKVLMASDFPLIRAKRILKQINEAALTPADRQKIVHDNAAALLGIA